MSECNPYTGQKLKGAHKLNMGGRGQKFKGAHKLNMGGGGSEAYRGTLQQTDILTKLRPETNILPKIIPTQINPLCYALYSKNSQS